MRFLHRISVAGRIYAIIFLATMGAIGATLYFDLSERARIEERVVAALDDRLEAATRLAKRFAEAADAGEMTEAFARARALALIGAMPVGRDGALLVFDETGRLIAQALPPEPTVETSSAAPSEEDARITRVAAFDAWGWTLRASVPGEAITREVAAARRAIEYPMIVGTLVIFLLSLALALSILAPMRALRVRLETMAEGDLSADIPHMKGRNELSEAARALADIRRNIRLFREKAAERAEALQTGVARIGGALDASAAAGRAPLVVEDLDKRLKPHLRAIEKALAAAEASAERRAAAQLGAAAERWRAEAERLTRASAAEAAVEEALGRMLAAATAARAVDDGASLGDQADPAAAKQAVDAVAYKSSAVAFDAALEAARAGKAGRGFTAVSKDLRALAAAAAAAAGETGVLAERAAAQRAALDGRQAALAAIVAAGDAFAEGAAARAEASQDANEEADDVPSAAAVLAAAAAALTNLAEDAETSAASAGSAGSGGDSSELDAASVDAAGVGGHDVPPSAIEDDIDDIDEPMPMDNEAEAVARAIAAMDDDAPSEPEPVSEDDGAGLADDDDALDDAEVLAYDVGKSAA